MKTLTTLLAFAIGTAASAAVIHVDLDDLVVPNTLDGIYINILTGDYTFEYPTAPNFPDFNDAPWLNLFLGGTGISNSELLRPWASQSAGNYDPDVSGHYFLNVAPGTTIDASGVFVGGETVSQFHMGGSTEQFQSGVTGYLAFEYMASSTSDVAYGWISFTPASGGDGLSFNIVYSDTPGEAITVGVIPEPASIAALAGAFGLGFAAYRRRRAAV